MAPILPKWFWAYLPPVLLLVALLVAIIMAYRLWHELHEDDEPVSDSDVLSDLEEAHAAGEIDDAEFSRVRALLNRPLDARLEPRPRREPRAGHAPPPLPEDASPPDDEPDASSSLS